MSAVVTVAAMLARGTDRADRHRRRLMTAAAAMATFFLLGAGNLLAIRGSHPSGRAGLITEEGLRGGTALALALLVIPPLALLYQAGRIAQATRERRLAALRLAGATPRDVRLIAVAEALRISAVGAVLGTLAYVAAQQAALAALEIQRPAVYALPPWPVPVVLALVVTAGAAAGLLSSRHVITSPLAVTRRAHRPRPRARVLAVPVVGLALMAGAWFATAPAETLLLFGGGIVTIAGTAAAAGRLVWEAARLAGRWARTPETLLAARTLQADPRGWGRALAVVGLVVLFGAGAGAIEAAVRDDARRNGEPLDGFWTTSLTLVNAALLLALLVAAAALVVHRAEWLLEGRRSLAALAAAGTPAAALRKVARRQALIAAGPICVIAAFTGLVGMIPGVLTGWTAWFVTVWAAGRALLTALAGIGAAVAVTAASRRLLARAAAPEQLRTE